MIFSIIVIVAIAAIAYFYYTQGLFSATLSAISAVLAAVLAFSYHETIVFSLLKGKMADYAHGLVLVTLFALGYLVLRVMFDSLIPGNLSLPLYVERVGAAVMGIVIGVFATGVLAIAAQTLPFGPGTPYPRFALDADRDVTVPTGGRDLDAKVYGQLKDAEPGKFVADNSGSLIIPVDNIVMNMVDRLSTGALAGARPLKSVHPSYLDEMFANRLGVQVGASRVAYNLPNLQQISLEGPYVLEQVAQADSDYQQLRGPTMKIDSLRKPMADQVLLVARVQFTRNSDDSDRNVRVSPATVRLFANGTNYLPVGTIDSAGVLRVNLPDDFLVLPAEQKVDFVFQVTADDLGLARSRNETTGSIRNGSFLEVKRMGQVDLAGRALAPYPGPLQTTVIRKRNLPEPTAAPGAATPAVAASAVADAPFVFDKVQVSAELFTSVNVGGADDDTELTFASGTARLKDGKFIQLSVNTTQTIELLSRGDYLVKEFFVPPGMKMVQIVGKPDNDRWQWADKLGSFELVDATGAKHQPHGAWAKATGGGGSRRMVAIYDAEKPVTALAPEEPLPTEVYIAFLVPEGTQLKELTFESRKLAALDQEVK